MFILHANLYNFKCPSDANWKYRAKEQCNNISNYFCLYNTIDVKYVEGCNGPDWDRKGSKRIYVGDFSRGKCKQDRFQPFKFWTNESMSDCIYTKSNCSEEGQIMQKENSPKDDRRCRCNHKKNYSFIITPRHLCHCIPTEEDCSCYIKSCPVNFTLSADYICTHNDNLGKPKCKDINKYYETLNETAGVIKERNDTWLSKRTFKLKQRDKFIATIICCIIVIGGFFIAVFLKWKSEIRKLFKRCIWRRQTDPEEIGVLENEHGNISIDTVEGNIQKSPESTLPDEEQSIYKLEYNVDNKETEVDVEEHQPKQRDTEEAKISAKEIEFEDIFDGNNPESFDFTTVEPVTEEDKYYLRIIHLLFRVVCPVVRMSFNRDIKHEQLRKTLDNNKAELRKRYRTKDIIINDDQWKLLYDPVKGKTVTSEDFDLRLMIYLLTTIASIDFGDLYPVKTDTRINAMLTRIKYIRNKLIQSIYKKHSDEHYDQFLDDLGEAALKLLPPHMHFNEYDKDKKQLIDRLLTLNPINVDNDKLCTFIVMSERYPAIILRKFISEFLTLNETTIERVLEEEKDQLYHKRQKTEQCCSCIEIEAKYMKLLTEEHWEALYELKDCTNTNVCQCNLKICSKLVVPKKDFKIASCDLSLAVSLILYIPRILNHYLCMNGFCNFLMKNQHTIYHSMEKKRCCKCDDEQIFEKSMISENEWTKIFCKHDGKSCQNGTKNCCCCYTPKEGMKCSDMKATLLSKIVHVAGPVSVLIKIGQATSFYFINWTINDHILLAALQDLLKMIKDETFCHDMLHQITSCNPSQLDETVTQNINPSRWISKHLRHQEAPTGPSLQIILLDNKKDDLNVRRIQIPKDFPSPPRTNNLTDLTTEENNFLVVVYGLKNVVYPVIKNEFDTQCPDHVLKGICVGLSKQQNANGCKGSSKDENKSRKKGIYLSQDQRTRLFSKKKEESKDLDLELMIYILKQRSNYEWNKDYIDQLDVIEKIRGEIVQSKSGILDHKTFKDILDRISKAFLHVGGEKYTEQLSSLKHIKNILE